MILTNLYKNSIELRNLINSIVEVDRPNLALYWWLCTQTHRNLGSYADGSCGTFLIKVKKVGLKLNSFFYYHISDLRRKTFYFTNV